MRMIPNVERDFDREFAKTKAALEAKQKDKKNKYPREPVQGVLWFLLNHAPLERWERAILAIIRDEAYYFSPQIQTGVGF